MTEATRYNAGKPEMSELLKFDNALENVILVMMQGAVKYEQDNWLRGGKPTQEYLDSAMRHIMAFIRGEIYDPETGCHHLAHATWNLLAVQRLNLMDHPPLDPAFDQDAFLKAWQTDLDVERYDA